MSHPTGTIYIVIAPSGAGKTSLVAALLAAEPLVELSISYTTRPRRIGEEDGKHYHFVTRSHFEEMIAQGDLLEYAEVYGNYYGTCASWLRARLAVGHDVLLEIDWQGARQVRRVFPAAISIFIMPPSMEELERRLRARATDSEEAIIQRLAEARSEISMAKDYNYIIINDVFECACIDLISIVHAQRLRGEVQCICHNELLSG